MSREIKFRAWDIENNKFFEPTYEAYKGNLEDLSVSFSGELIMRTLTIPAKHESLFPERFILQQYTGLKDKNGVEIFEGDLLRIDLGKSDAVLCEVIYEAPSFCRKWLDAKTISIRRREKEAMAWNTHIIYEVIGNIYEHPHLLEVQQ